MRISIKKIFFKKSKRLQNPFPEKYQVCRLFSRSAVSCTKEEEMALAKIGKLVSETKYRLGQEGLDAIPSLQSFVKVEGLLLFFFCWLLFFVGCLVVFCERGERHSFLEKSFFFLT